jgi:sugar (pentulose or hexulose) kinase
MTPIRDPADRPPAVLVLDVGKTNVKLVAVDPLGWTVLGTRIAPNEPVPRPPYLHCPVEHIARWLTAALTDVAESYEVLAIVPTTYGSTAALIDESGLVTPVMDYEVEIPEDIAAAYAAIAPPFEECFCPVNPQGQTLGRQLYWQSRLIPLAFERARHILPFPQYWGWRLTGAVASEVTSLGAQTQLWRPREGRLSSLVERLGWADKLPPMRRAWEVLGTLEADLAERTGLPPSTPVLVGIHDSNANYTRYLAAGHDDVTLLSTGTWLIGFNPAMPVEALDPARDTVSNTDLLGRPVASSRYMGGREHRLLAGEGGRGSLDEVRALVRAGTTALPDFTASGGPFPRAAGKGRVLGPAPETGSARAALASLYVALMADVCLDLLRSENPIVIDGGFVDDPLLAEILAALRLGQPVLVSPERDGTAIGAALLYGWEERTRPVALELRPVPPPAIAGLAGYARAWREAAEAIP